MDIAFASKDLQNLCNDTRTAKKKLGADCAKKLRSRLDDLSSASTLAVCRTLPGRCHELTGDRVGQLAVDLHGGVRLLFRPDHDPVPTKADGGLDWNQVTRICVEGVEDYH